MKMNHIYYLIFLLTISIYSCVSPVKLYNDRVKDVMIYSWEQTKTVSSKMSRNQRTFWIDIKKYGKTNENVHFYIDSSFPVTNAAYADTAYFLESKEIIPILFVRIDDVRYREQTNTATTTTNSDVKVETNTSTVVVPVATITDTANEKNTTTSTTTTSTSNTDTKVSSEILDKVHSKRFLVFENQQMVKLFKLPSVTLRIYNTSNDHWDLKFSSEEMAKVRKLLSNNYDVNIR